MKPPSAHVCTRHRAIHCPAAANPAARVALSRVTSSPAKRNFPTLILTYAFNHSLTHAFNHSPTVRSLSHSRTHILTYSLIHARTHSLTALHYIKCPPEHGPPEPIFSANDEPLTRQSRLSQKVPPEHAPPRARLLGGDARPPRVKNLHQS